MRVPGKPPRQARLARHHDLRDARPRAASSADSHLERHAARDGAVASMSRRGLGRAERRPRARRPRARRPRRRGRRGCARPAPRARASAASSALTLSDSPAGPLRHRRDDGHAGPLPTARSTAGVHGLRGAAHPAQARPQAARVSSRASRPEMPTAGRPGRGEAGGQRLVHDARRGPSPRPPWPRARSRAGRPRTATRCPARAACARRGGRRRGRRTRAAARRRAARRPAGASRPGSSSAGPPSL